MAARQILDILRLKNKKVEKLEFMIKTKFNMKRNIALFFLSLLGLTAQPTQAVAKEAYAVVSPDGTTLTFYFDEKKSLREGTAYELKLGKDYPKWVRLSGHYSLPESPDFPTEIMTVIFDESFKDARPVSCAYWFAGFNGLKKIEGIANLNTSKVTDMSFMFYGCHVESLDLSGFDTSKVTNMGSMFEYCRSLESLDVSGFDTSNVTDMSEMFSGCVLTSIDLSRFDTSKVTNMTCMFDGCENLKSLDLSSFDTSNVTEMGSMFENCNQLESLDLSRFNTSKVTDMVGMFSRCESMEKLDLSRFNTSQVTDMSRMFEFCENLKTLDLSGFNTSNVEDMVWMFSDCENLKNLDISSFDTSNVTDMRWMFSNCESLKTIYVGTGWKTNKVEESEEMFWGCTSLVGGKGTEYDSEIVDKTRAKIDGGKANPGYFTAKK
ncbi:MAG: BspA family leucine-rich repeat surface protein [Bacteroidaceae bacterium]|nr:BspA family leucine-rich repeat surface protein [Bacteroidaceae bacterium]